MTVPLVIVSLITVAVLIFGARAIDRIGEDSEKKAIFHALYAVVALGVFSGSTAFLANAVFHGDVSQVCMEACSNCYKALAAMWVGPLLVGLLLLWAKRAGKPLVFVSYLLTALIAGQCAVTCVLTDRRMDGTRDYYLQHPMPSPNVQK